MQTLHEATGAGPLLARPLFAGPDDETTQEHLVRGGAVLVTLASAAIHFAVVEEHFREYWLFGLFFAAVAWVQVIWAVGIVVSRSRWLCLAGVLGSLVLVGLWISSRTVGIPIGPEPWTPEPVGFPDMLSTLLEGAAVVGGWALLWSNNLERSPSTGKWVGSTLAALGVTAATSAAIMLSGAHGHVGMVR